MAFPKKRDIFLANCLLESIEDENYRNTRKLLVEHHANPNLLIPESNIAPIHFAAGMENTEFAEAAMKLILKCNGDPNVQTIEGETPLHVAVIWNRTLIVEMLLDHGADLSITDNDQNTPINHAITEKHYNLIPIFQNHIFEKKLQKKMDAKQLKNQSEQTSIKPIDTVIKSLQQLDISKNVDNEGFLTPNRTNFNFKEASPFLVNINCRRPKYRKFETMKSESELKEKEMAEPNNINAEVIEISDSDDNENNTKNNKLVKNLFELTEENIEKHLAMVVKKKRKDSLIHLWRNKVNESRQRKSLLPIDENEFEAFLSENTEDAESPSIESSHQSVETVVPAKPKLDINSATEDSFFTAVDQNADINPDTAKHNTNCESNNKSEFIFQAQEVYEHVDVQNNIVFYENKLLAKPVKMLNSGINSNQDVINLNTSSESGTCTDLVGPSDYDTDDLRKELKSYGDVPGPITNKNIKRLYLKRLIRYKRRPQSSLQNLNQRVKCNFSVELQKTMRKDIESLDLINEYAALERQMVNSLLSCPSKNKNMREGNFKKSFIYLLIDPRIAENLLADSQIIAPSEVWSRFLHSIFYVGKGKSSRPYAHLYDAIKMYNEENQHVEKMSESLKLDRIIEIWKANKGVFCLPVFHNITPVEAYTREAAIIDCIGVENLTNIKRGDYYGIAKSWTMRDRKRLGVLLLYKAMKVFMVEGESQLRPNDIK